MDSPTTFACGRNHSNNCDGPQLIAWRLDQSACSQAPGHTQFTSNSQKAGTSIEAMGMTVDRWLRLLVKEE